MPERECIGGNAELSALNLAESYFQFKGPMVDRMKEIGFKADPANLSKTVRIVSSFVGIEPRPYWVECQAVRLQSTILLPVLHQPLAVGQLEFTGTDRYGARSFSIIFLLEGHGDSDDVAYRK
jgi:hypothetical protein